MTGEPKPSRAAPTSRIPFPDTARIEPRLDWFKQELERCSDTVFHTFDAKGEIPCAIIYFQGMFDYRSVQTHVLEPMIGQAEPGNAAAKERNLLERTFASQDIPMARTIMVTDPAKAVDAVLNGHGVLLVEGDARMLEFPFPLFEKRALDEAPNESVIRGPREAFVESLDTNLTLLRRRIRSRHFKTEQLRFGRQTQTSVVLAYLEGVCPDTLVEEMKRRLACLRIDGVLGSSVIEEAVADTPFSPFPLLQYSERPDTVSASILEGRIAVLVDNTPIVLVAPVTFFMLLQSAEDYYQPFIAASWIRWIRFLFLGISLLLPSFYIAISTFHPEMIPFNLLISVSSSREIVPFPALMEALIMEIAFEALREASVRIPKSIGQAVSIIGALIIGTAAVQAGIASAAMVIIVSVTGIASFIIPNFDLGLSFRLLRFPMMLLAGAFGIFGIACGLILMYVHMLNLQSFGTPYLSPLAPRVPDAVKDTLYRSPWWSMRTRPFTAQKSNRVRESPDLRAWARSSKGEEGD